jgi:hypothetical protein
MSDDAERGDHDYVDPHDPKLCQAGCLPIPVFDAENAAIKKRRESIKAKGNRDRTAYPSCTGLSLSGGGIRSASFGLGALQALHAYSGIEGIDYLSMVSGGGYIGCSLTAATQESTEPGKAPDAQKFVPAQKVEDKFPFTNPNNYDDTDAVRHIRDYSNYLVPHGTLDFVTAIGLIGRGLVANVLIILPVLLFAILVTLVTHPAVTLLDEPRIFDWNLAGTDAPSHAFWGLHGFWFTAILLLVNLLFLTVWALYTSLCLGPYRTLTGGWVGVSKILFGVTLTVAFIEFQPYILWLLTKETAGSVSVNAGSIQHGGAVGRLWSYVSSYVAAFLAAMGTVFAFFSKYLGDVVAAAKHAAGWPAWLKKMMAMAALWLAALAVPFALWVLYLFLTYLGLGSTSIFHLYLGAFFVTLLLAICINPNRTSLYRLYRDRLCKAFLFDPKLRERDGDRDLKSRDPKLSEIDTNLCPYPIINAALNIEGSAFANKRGRNADFFIFTPEYAGSDATGYLGTKQIQKEEPTLDLGTAMAISGAAVSSNMGALTIRPLAFTLAVLNIRLGYWLRNPFVIGKKRSFLSRLLDVRSFLLFKEAFSLITEKSPTVYLTDGGHIENLGVYSLMKRRCKLIIAIDAEADPTMSFGSLLILERYARIDLGATIDLPWQATQDCTLAVDKAFDKADQDGSAIPGTPGPHCAAAEIQYGPNENEKGILLYAKASLSGDEDDYILDYKRRYRAFPHETTGDQFFDEEQLEVYRALGFHIVKGVLTGDAPFAVEPRWNETQGEAQLRILMAVREALLGGIT